MRDNLDITFCLATWHLTFCAGSCLIGLYLIGASTLLLGLAFFVTASYSALVMLHFNYVRRRTYGDAHFNQVRAFADVAPTEPVGQPAYYYVFPILS